MAGDRFLFKNVREASISAAGLLVCSSMAYHMYVSRRPVVEGQAQNGRAIVVSGSKFNERAPRPQSDTRASCEGGRHPPHPGCCAGGVYVYTVRDARRRARTHPDTRSHTASPSRIKGPRRIGNVASDFCAQSYFSPCQNQMCCVSHLGRDVLHPVLSQPEEVSFRR